MSSNVPTVMIVDGISLYCLSCKALLPLDKFRKENGRGYARDCLDCEHIREECKKPPLRPRQLRHRNAPYTNKHLRQKKEHLVAVSGGNCHRCGYNEFIAGFDFHHVQLKIHRKRITQMSLKKALEEIDKCIMLCRCCHTSLHANFWHAKFIKRNGIGWTIEPGTTTINTGI